MSWIAEELLDSARGIFLLVLGSLCRIFAWYRITNGDKSRRKLCRPN